MKSVSVQVLYSELRRRSVALFLVVGGLALAGLPAVVDAKVFYARAEALTLAFPDAEKIEARDFILTVEQHARVEKLSRATLDTRLVTVYEGWYGGKPQKFAVFDSQNVRTFAATILVVISPAGAVQGTHVLAFHEPQEYLPPQRWLDRFHDKTQADEMQIGRDIAGITGSTLSTRAVSTSVRRALAVWGVTIGGR